MLDVVEGVVLVVVVEVVVWVVEVLVDVLVEVVDDVVDEVLLVVDDGGRVAAVVSVEVTATVVVVSCGSVGLVRTDSSVC